MRPLLSYKESAMQLLFRRAVFGPLVVFSISLLAAALAYADGLFCSSCGASSGCCKVCRLVREDKKITVTCWASKDEDFCLGGPSRRDCDHCEMVCDEKTSDPKAPCAHPKRMVWSDWIPNCHARMYTKHKLMKKTVTKSVPSFKWVVEDMCGQCKSRIQVVEVPEGSEVPKPPVTAGVEQIPKTW